MSQQSKPTSFLVLLVVLAVALLLVSSLLTPNSTQSLQYSDMLDLFRNEKVASFTLEGSNLTMQVRCVGDKLLLLPPRFLHWPDRTARQQHRKAEKGKQAERDEQRAGL